MSIGPLGDGPAPSGNDHSHPIIPIGRKRKLTPEDSKIFDMKTNLCLIFISVFLTGCASSPRIMFEEDISTYKIVSDHVNCNKNWLGSVVCNYKIGNDLKMRIVGVDGPHPRINVIKSVGKKGDFYPSLPPGEGAFYRPSRSFDLG